MFKIESYVTPILLSYVDKYVRDFKPADAQVSLWGGGVALHNLVLKADVLQHEVALPFTLVSGRIHELLIQVPWTKIMSEPIVVTIDTIECVLSLHPPAASEETLPAESPRSTVVEAPPGYMQALVRRIVSNISLRVHHLIVKYVQDDIVLSLNVKHLCVESAGADWAPAFADIDQSQPVVRRLMRLDDLTLCLDRADSDGKIRFYQEPLLYRCQLDFRILTRLVSANTRRASCLTVQLRSSKLAWGVTSEQLTLLLRLLRERQNQVNTSPPPPKLNATNSAAPLGSSTSNAAEPVRTESWSEWAWSWLPTWMDKEGGVEEATMPPMPIPVQFSAYLDHVSLVFKVMEAEGSARKRARGVMELSACHAAARAALCAPTTLRVRVGMRQLRLLSRGKCICGHQDLNAINDEPTIYLEKRSSEDDKEPWSWPENLETLECKVETAEAAEEVYIETSDLTASPAEPKLSSIEEDDATDELWRMLSPVVLLRYSHTRSPPDDTNPYESPPVDFQYSDWQEENKLKITLKPLDIYLGMGLLHRISAIQQIFHDLPSVPVPDVPMRTLTVEECEALDANIPQRRTFLVMRGLRLRVLPWDHSLSEKPTSPSLVLDVESPEVKLIVSGPLYPHRVCSAACQMPKEEGPLWQGARLHVSATLAAVEARLCRLSDGQARPVARVDLRFVLHLLLHPEMFTKKETVHTSYNIKICEMNTCGSAARLQAAWHVLQSLIEQRPSQVLRHTWLVRDALSDEESVAIDATMEDVSVRGFITRTVNTHITMVQSARVMALYSPNEGNVKQAWIFSAPDSQTTTAFVRVALQWCVEQANDTVDYLGVWTEPVAFCVDPLFIAWLAYKPLNKAPSTTLETAPLSRASSSSQSYLRRRVTPPSSSGRGASRTGSGSELVHAARLRSLGSSSEHGETRRPAPPPPAKTPETLLHPDRLLKLHACLQQLLVSVEVGTAMVYFTTGTASAEGCAAMRDAVERLAAGVPKQQVLVFSMGRLTVSSSSMMKHLWDDVRHDGPTFITKPTTEEPMESFPWKLRLADVTCYTLEIRQYTDAGRVQGGVLRSTLKSSPISTRLVLEAVTTTVTLSIVSKYMQIRSWKVSPEQQKASERSEPPPEELRVQYFKSGIDFKPSTLKEFVRGPARLQRSQSPQEGKQSNLRDRDPKEKTTQGPVVSMGMHLHADTPPVTVRLEHDQVNIVAAAVHCLTHLHMVMSRTPVAVSRSYTSLPGTHDQRSLIRSVSELNEQDTPSDENLSESYSELIPIFESRAVPEVKLKTFFWFQWVVGRATLVVATHQSKLAMEIDDIISTVDIQEHYNQLKVKVASASVRHYKRSHEDWEAGVLGGRVLEAREPIDSKEEDHFLAITITQAQISNLPASWKEELHPKLLQQKGAGDSMWEIYATLAPLEAVLQPSLIENIMSLVREMAPPSFCPLQSEDEPSNGSTWQWPFCYVTAGGLRLLVNTDLHDPENDDTFLLLVGKVSINPHPENPICRQSVTTGLDGSWNSTGGSPEGRQYEVNVKHVAIQSAQLQQIIKQEERREIYNKGTGSENPAVKWSQPPVPPVVTAILHHVDISCIIAPPLFVNGALTCGPALELNLASDCAFEISLEQLKLVQHLLSEASSSTSSSEDSIPSMVATVVVCPYAALFLNPKQTPESRLQDSNAESIKGVAEVQLFDESSNTGKSDRGFTTDSGIDVATSMSRIRLDRPASKKNLNVAFAEEIIDASEYLEVFVTMGVIEISLYMEDDNSPAAVALRPPSKPEQNTEEAQQALKLPRARLTSGKLALLHITLHQPNLYYWRKKTRKNLQVSLFNAWIGLGAGEKDGSQPLFSTSKGTPDPVTDIPPALATVKIVIPTGGSGPSNYSGVKGSVTVDVERPVLLGLSADTLRRLTLINQLVQENLQNNYEKGSITFSDSDLQAPPFLKLRKIMVSNTLENIVIQMNQLGVTGSEGTIGWDSASLQIGAAARPERLVARALVSALLVATGPLSDQRHILLQPMMLGMDLECSWEAWRRAEDGVSAREPSVRMTVDLDRVTLDVRPEDLAALRRIQLAIDTLADKQMCVKKEEKELLAPQKENSDNLRSFSKRSMCERVLPSLESVEASDQYYKDDLKSGAFKIVTGGQFPMAYQVTVHGDAMSWRYPHPRTITRITVFPIPGIDEEVKCKLEFYDPLLKKWEPHTYVTLPVSEPNEIKLYAEPPDAVFATLWRFRADSDTKPEERTFEFDISKFMPRADPLATDRVEPPAEAPAGLVSAEQLSSALRVDSYFSPRSVPRVRAALRCTEFELYAHNSLPSLSRNASTLEGYYVSRPLMRSHRVLCVSAVDTVAHALLGSRAGRVLLLNTKLSCDVLDCSTGTLEQMVGLTRVQASASVPSDVAVSQARVRACSECVRVALHVPRLSTLRALAEDWGPALQQCNGDVSTENEEKDMDSCNDSEADLAAMTELEGRVSLWLYNSCSSALRVGQEGCEEIAPLRPGARLAYRWPSPNAPFKIRFALAGPSTDWQWSSSIPFSSGESRVRLPDVDAAAGGVYVHVRGDVAGARRTLHLSGRLVLANVLRRPLHYKVRAKNASSKAWYSVCSGELNGETVGRSVLCGVDCEMVLKIKFTTQDTGWSGDIPLKECPKENVPWLVKVPSEGETAYVSVWCRVVRARSDGRVLAAIWPLYVLCSHLPLDTDVLVSTQKETSEAAARPSPLVQTALGRGACTHLLAPGTTAARHQLSFQYKDVEHPVTREAIPLHYGVTDTSVFDKRAPANNINEIVEEIREWFDRSARRATSDWPYSIVASHWSGTWSPASLQPRCDVTVRYDAVRAGGGCSLQISLRPVALLCNAARVPLTLRAHDAAPLCRLEPGAAVSAPSALLQKPFFMSVEIGRETFVSGQLQVWGEEPGRYGSPPRGCVALDHPAPFLIHCKQKVAFLTLHYEIKEEINVLGVTSSFLLINRLETNLLVSGIAVPVANSDDVNLQPKNYKVVSPTKGERLNGEAMSRFWVLERWRGGDPSELRTYVCLALPAQEADAAEPAHAHVPVLLASAPVRRAVALRDHTGTSIPVVIVQQKHEGRWVVTVAPDPCPQFVVHNRSSHALAIAQPALSGPAKTIAECPGTRWLCSVEAGGVVHYSTPAHSARFPPPPNAAPNTDLIPFLTISKINEQRDPEWSEGVAAAGGEQLVQLPDGGTVKLRVRPYPHSSLLELKDVDENDISASVIRRRLEGSFCADTDTGEEVIKKRSEGPRQLTAPTQAKLARVTVVTTAISTAPDNAPGEHTNSPSENENAESGFQTKEFLKLQKYDESTSKLEKIDETTNLLYVENEDSGDMLKTVSTYLSDNSMLTLANVRSYQESADALRDFSESEWGDKGWSPVERVRCVIAGIAIEMAATPDVSPLLALHIDRAAFSVQCDSTGTKAVISIADIQVDNLQYESGNYDFAVVASTRGESLTSDAWPPLWPSAAGDAFAMRENEARLLLRLRYDSWTVIDEVYRELTEVELRLGPLALYVEDGYVGALARLARAARPAGPASAPVPGAIIAAETRSIQCPLRLRSLHLHPVDLTLTLHTAVRMYIALDQSPLCLSAFQQTDMVTCAERLTHALTVHYLSAAILGAGWVVGGLELLGAPGALAARVGGARGGVRGVAAAAAAALLRSLSACAGSLARNLDLLAGDDDHARRAAAARRRHPDTFVQGLAAGITNFAINILGAVGGLAHHPLVSVAVGEVEGGAAALRRGLLGALTKPLSATADLVAFAGHGLLRQTGWDPVPQRRSLCAGLESGGCGWRRDCVRWSFRLAEVDALAGFDVLLDDAPLRLLLTHKYLMITDPETERIVEMVDLRLCTLRPHQGPTVELVVTRRQKEKVAESRAVDEDDEYQVNSAAMARVARYTGADGGVAPAPSAARVLALQAPARHAPALRAALAAALHAVSDDHLHLF
ncbi:intermembrane lipid transfer protein VPS13B isoform X2 [Cydia pomonella]|uniref:intermembrane lipid transfer protein VPS13B isoform X2 n=1 Tax=Cydia pomonella TaxID=82600 RepID=UPI002ADE7246|nr:intermembrane lipid transfer protein VPS13B isoform X2 [Cydia pomonella]